METARTYPGTPQHQALLQAIVAYYHADARVLAVSLFGSLVRGAWDQYSDLDLDVVIADEVQIDVPEELKKLCASLAAIGQLDPVIVADGADAGDVVLASLMQLSIRYHPLATTSPNIVDSLRVLAGSLDRAAIVAAGRMRPHPPGQTLAALLARVVRYVVVADVAAQRGQLWAAVEMLHRLRAVAMELYALAHGGGRALQAFQTEADSEMQARLGGTLPKYDLASVREALERYLEFLENDLDQLTGGQAQLSTAHRKVLAHVRARQALPDVTRA